MYSGLGPLQPPTFSVLSTSSPIVTTNFNSYTLMGTAIQSTLYYSTSGAYTFVRVTMTVQYDVEKGAGMTITVPAISGRLLQSDLSKSMFILV